jgi:hypothetical protein
MTFLVGGKAEKAFSSEVGLCVAIKKKLPGKTLRFQDIALSRHRAFSSAAGST